MSVVRVECSMCGEIVEVITGGTLAVPYTCNSCEREVTEFQDKIAPAKTVDIDFDNSPLIEILQTLPGEGKWIGRGGKTTIEFTTPLPKPVVFNEHECGDGCTDAGCDSASVEATTELIVNLEEQIKTLTESNDALAELVATDNTVIEDLKSQLDGVVTDNLKLTEQRNDAAIDRDEKADKLARLTQAYQNLLEREMRAHLDLVRLRLAFEQFRQWTENLLDEAAANWKRETAAKEYYAKEHARTYAKLQDAYQENFALKGRGFWARVFNASRG